MIQKDKEALPDSQKVLHKAKVDTLAKVFYTRGKRKVYGSGGITPDIQIVDPSNSPYLSALRKKGMLFLFPSFYCASHKVMPTLPMDRKALMVSFVDFLRRKKFVYISDTERRFNELKEGIKKNSGANASDWKILGEMQQEVNRLREREISKESERVGLVLEEEIIRNYNQRLARKVELDHDPFVKKAVEVLSDPRKYSGILHP